MAMVADCACYRFLYIYVSVCTVQPDLVSVNTLLSFCFDACQRLRANATTVATRPWRENPAVITHNRLTVCTFSVYCWTQCISKTCISLNFPYCGHPPDILAAWNSVLPLSFRSFFFCRLISGVASPIVTKLCHVFAGDLDLYNLVRNLGGPSPEIWWPKISKFWRDFVQLRDLITNISGMQQDIVNRKTAMQTMVTPAQASFIRCTLVHKRRKVGAEFWPTKRAAITLGIATHLFVCVMHARLRCRFFIFIWYRQFVVS